MAYTFDLESTDETLKQISLVRDLIDDVASVANPTEGADYFVSDARISARLFDAAMELPPDANALEIRLLAASSIEGTLAKNQAFVLKKLKTLGAEYDGPAVSKEIREHAAELAQRAFASLKNRRADAAAAASKPVTRPSGSFVMETVF